MLLFALGIAVTLLRSDLDFPRPMTRAMSLYLLITTCAPDRWAPLLESMRPLLQRIGGTCLVSAAQWLRH